MSHETEDRGDTQDHCLGGGCVWVLGYPEAAVPEVSRQPCPQWYFISLNAADSCCAHPNLQAVQMKAYEGGMHGA